MCVCVCRWVGVRVHLCECVCILCMCACVYIILYIPYAYIYMSRSFRSTKILRLASFLGDIIFFVNKQFMVSGYLLCKSKQSTF